MKLLLILFLCTFAFWVKGAFPNLRKINDGEEPIPKSRIIGGTVAPAGEFPWQVAIYKTAPDGRYFCAGAIISEVWILTAAQCVYDATGFSIQMGSQSLNSADPNRVTVTATLYYYYDLFDPTNLRHDVGVIKLDSPITFNTYIQPLVYVPFGGYLWPGEELTAAGWGQVSDTATDLVDELEIATVHVIDQFECQAYYGTPALWNSMICTQGTTNQGICLGDVGGILTTPTLVGNFSVGVAIASWVSQNGCESTDPKGHTRVDSYHDWIFNTTRDN